MDDITRKKAKKLTENGGSTPLAHLESSIETTEKLEELKQSIENLSDILDNATGEMAEKMGATKPIILIKERPGEPGKDAEAPSEEYLLSLIGAMMPSPIPGPKGEDSDVPGPSGPPGPKGDAIIGPPGPRGKDADEITGVQIKKKLGLDLEDDLTTMKKVEAIIANRDQLLLQIATQRYKSEHYIVGVNTDKLTVSATQPANPKLNDLWYDIS